MPIAKRIIPCLDVMYGRTVKGINFKNLRDAGDLAELAERYCDDGADELVLLDVTASSEKRKVIVDVVRRVALEINIPFTVGGGIRTINDVREILSNGADKISINTAAVENPNIISKLSKIFGSQCVVVAIDAKRRYDIALNKTIVETSNEPCWFEVCIYGGQKPTSIDAISHARRVVELGAGELLVTSMDMDGTENSYDIELTKATSESVNVPIIASGGAGEPKHIFDVLTIGKADAALAASIFHYLKYPVGKVKKYLYKMGVQVRF